MDFRTPDSCGSRKIDAFAGRKQTYAVRPVDLIGDELCEKKSFLPGGIETYGYDFRPFEGITCLHLPIRPHAILDHSRIEGF